MRNQFANEGEVFTRLFDGASVSSLRPPDPIRDRELPVDELTVMPGFPRGYGEREEELILDPRGDLSPSLRVERKLLDLLGTAGLRANRRSGHQ